NPRREIGPLILMTPIKTPLFKTGALTLATPSSRSSMLCAHPCSKISLVFDESVLISSQAKITFPAEPTSNGYTAPTGTVFFSPAIGSTETRQTRLFPSLTYNCVLSPSKLRRLLNKGFVTLISSVNFEDSLQPIICDRI